MFSVSSLKDEIENLKKENLELKTKLSSANRKAIASDSQMFIKTKRQLNKEIHSLKRIIRILENDKNCMKEVIQFFQTDIRELTQETDQMLKEYEFKKNETEDLRKKIDKRKTIIKYIDTFFK